MYGIEYHIVTLAIVTMDSTQSAELCTGINDTLQGNNLKTFTTNTLICQSVGLTAFGEHSRGVVPVCHELELMPTHNIVCASQ